MELRPLQQPPASAIEIATRKKKPIPAKQLSDGAVAVGAETFLPSGTFRGLVSWLCTSFEVDRCADIQRLLSEILVFVALGLSPEDSIITEELLQRILFLRGTKTPEGVFSWKPRGPLVQVFGAHARVRATVEVKRVAFLHLPKYLPSSYRHRYGRGEFWFLEMIQEAVDEITPHFVERFNVQAHIVGIAVPMSMGVRERRKLRSAVHEHVEVSRCPVPLDFWIVPEPDAMFGKLLRPGSFKQKHGKT